MHKPRFRITRLRNWKHFRIELFYLPSLQKVPHEKTSHVLILPLKSLWKNISSWYANQILFSFWTYLPNPFQSNNSLQLAALFFFSVFASSTQQGMGRARTDVSTARGRWVSFIIQCLFYLKLHSWACFERQKSVAPCRIWIKDTLLRIPKKEKIPAT